MMTTPLQIQSSFLNLSSSLFYSDTLPFRPNLSSVCHIYSRRGRVSLTCSISKVPNNGTVDSEPRPSLKWSVLFTRIAKMENPELGCASVLNQWENEAKSLTKWELWRIVWALKKCRRYDKALEVFDWINNQPERFTMSATDVAIHLDLIARVHGVSGAEGFFLNLTDDLKDERTHEALLSAYVHSRSKEKAESLFDVMRSKRYLTDSLPFKLMMSLYRSLEEYDKVDMLVSEMKEKNIQLDIYTYTLWLSSQGSIKKMEQVFEQMSMDPTVIPIWSTFTTMAAIYIKKELFEKALECLKKAEGRMLGRNRTPFLYLLSLYGSIGNKDEVYRVWNNYKSVFSSVPNLGYHAEVLIELLRKSGYHNNEVYASLFSKDELSSKIE